MDSSDTDQLRSPMGVGLAIADGAHGHGTARTRQPIANATTPPLPPTPSMSSAFSAVAKGPRPPLPFTWFCISPARLSGRARIRMAPVIAEGWRRLAAEFCCCCCWYLYRPARASSTMCVFAQCHPHDVHAPHGAFSSLAATNARHCTYIPIAIHEHYI